MEKINKGEREVGLAYGFSHSSSSSTKRYNTDFPRIGIIAKPSAQFVAGMWATWLCRGTAVPLALGYPNSELLHVLSDAVSISWVPREMHQMGFENIGWHIIKNIRWVAY
jgi:malonyl-CoA/methylmalonyl-CoA synthetase